MTPNFSSSTASPFAMLRNLVEDFSTPNWITPPKSQTAALIGGKRLRVIHGGKSNSQADALKRTGVQIDAVAPTARIQKEFDRLCAVWKRETQSTSSLREAAMNHAYQRIIGLGSAAAPLIIAELKREPDWWFWALRAITGADPVREDDRGRLAAMTNTWLQWWESDGVTERWRV